MEYSFVGDPKLRERLEKARNQNKNKKENNNSKILNVDGKESINKYLEKKRKKIKKIKNLKV